ncbi:uncharacterized protein [Acropora muricata]|uniref:uncharacterized protein n=1 Tax=Acropora muricata TaxID=159855 RepID=UPI0034E5C23C
MASTASASSEASMTETTGDQKLCAWTQTYTKLLISLRKEKDDLFSKGKVRKNIAWQRVAEKFNSTSEVIVTWEQCSNEWKKLEERYKKIQEHNGKTGNDRKDMEFSEELSDFFGNDPKIIPCSSVSSMAANPCKGDETSSDEKDAARSEAPKKKRKRKSKSSASEMIEFLKEFKDDKQKEEKEKLAALNKMHMEKMNVMDRFLSILSKK